MLIHVQRALRRIDLRANPAFAPYLISFACPTAALSAATRASAATEERHSQRLAEGMITIDPKFVVPLPGGDAGDIVIACGETHALYTANYLRGKPLRGGSAHRVLVTPLAGVPWLSQWLSKPRARDGPSEHARFDVIAGIAVVPPPPPPKLKSGALSSAAPQQQPPQSHPSVLYVSTHTSQHLLDGGVEAGVRSAFRAVTLPLRR